jgi:hypothetical protein
MPWQFSELADVSAKSAIQPNGQRKGSPRRKLGREDAATNARHDFGRPEAALERYLTGLMGARVNTLADYLALAVSGYAGCYDLRAW